MAQHSTVVTTPLDFGALVREARERLRWTQTQLGDRIGASRFWVAEFERGKAGAELGLALRAVAAVGLRLRIDRTTASEVGAEVQRSVTPREGPGSAPRSASGTRAAAPRRSSPAVVVIDLDEIVGSAAAAIPGAPVEAPRPTRQRATRAAHKRG